jgi:type IV pilus assembly protein PilO
MAKSLKDLPAGVQALIFVLLIVAAVGTVGYFYVLPLYNAPATAPQPGLVALQAQEKDLEAKVASLRAFEAKLIEYQNQVAQLQKQLANLTLLLPETRQTDLFMKTVFGNAAQSDVHVRTFVPGAEAQKDFYMETPFTVRLDGTYWSLVNFFARLANEQRIISVSSVGLGKPSGGGLGAYAISENETVGVNAVLTTYFRHEAPAKPKPGAPAPSQK